MITCRFCASRDGETVLDAGLQPAGDNFPLVDDRGPDALHPLRMWMCGACRLAQLTEDPTVPDEPRGREPEALVRQARDAVQMLASTGYLTAGSSVVEFGSPHGGSWLDLIQEYGAVPCGESAKADVLVDNIGMMHAADQAAALRERLARLAPHGTAFFQYHSLATIVARGQWNALRHGHYAYYSTPALVTMLESVDLTPVTARWYPLYGGTVLLGARRGGAPDGTVSRIADEEEKVGVLDPARVRSLQHACSTSSAALATFIGAELVAGRRVAGYSAASRAVALLCTAGIGLADLFAVADASEEKWGRRLPGSRIPIVSPAQLVDERPDTVVLFVPDLLEEVRRALPQVEEWGGRWVVAEDLVGDEANAL
ncbi:class I SAM-dependent methyltransferase [Pseudonocardia halophobica]|uniref:class I SAM-dependent methyltransferase n=1 Tax=Pseudonocardia halophobica TaxID=29401 RepID=UPI003D93E5BB